jgi:hypothetical protein
MDKATLVKLASSMNIETDDKTVADLVVSLSEEINRNQQCNAEINHDQQFNVDFELKRLQHESDMFQAQVTRDRDLAHDVFKQSEIQAERMSRESEALRLHELEMAHVKSKNDLDIARMTHELEMARIQNGVPVVDSTQVPSFHNNRPLRIEKLRDNDDPLIFFAALEKMFVTRHIVAADCTGHLVELLGPKALDVFAKLSLQQSQDYASVKLAILKRFKVSAETTREQFRSIQKGKEDAFSEFAVKLTSLASTWLQDEATGRLHDSNKILDIILLEQFLSNVPNEIRTWLLDKNVTNIVEAADYADNYLQVRRGVNNHTVVPNVQNFTNSQHNNSQQGVKRITPQVNARLPVYSVPQVYSNAPMNARMPAYNVPHSSTLNAHMPAYNVPYTSSAVNTDMSVNNETFPSAYNVPYTSNVSVPAVSTVVPNVYTKQPVNKWKNGTAYRQHFGYRPRLPYNDGAQECVNSSYKQQGYATQNLAQPNQGYTKQDYSKNFQDQH